MTTSPNQASAIDVNATQDVYNPELIKWINSQSAIQHENNKKWWYHLDTGQILTRNVGEMLALVHSEISESWQGLYQFDDKLPEQNGGLVEIADALIRIFDILGAYGIVFPEEQKFFAMPLSENNPIAFAFNECHSSVSNLLETYRKDAKNTDKINLNFFSLINNLLCLYDLIFDGILLGTIVEFSTLEKFNPITAIEAVRLKAEYNKVRADHKPENRRAEGGKTF